jgi:co-chaperonin GroES (HSP10)
MTSKPKWKITMSKIVLPHGTKPVDEPVIKVAPAEPEAQSVEEKATQLPQPSGYHILCAIPDAEEKYESGIIKADITLKHEEALSTVLFVVKIGPDAYKDTNKFPTGPWCKEGDFVITRPNAGSRLLIHGKEWRIINDDTVEAVVQDPRGIKRK